MLCGHKTPLCPSLPDALVAPHPLFVVELSECDRQVCPVIVFSRRSELVCAGVNGRFGQCDTAQQPGADLSVSGDAELGQDIAVGKGGRGYRRAGVV
jgi:hypothetical protein